MRKRIANPTVVAGMLVLAGALSFGALRGEAADGDGKAVFLAQKCNMCHGVSTAGIEATTKSDKMKGPDLVGVVAEKGKDWTTKYLKKEVDLDGKKHSKEVKLADAEMATLLSWLETQKK
jgi:mono/diheme cytochrome c family protein